MFFGDKIVINGEEVNLGGMLSISGSELTLNDVSVYATGGDLPRGSVGAGVFLKTLRTKFLPAAWNQGFSKVTINATRVSEGPEQGHNLSLSFDNPAPTCE